MNTCDSCKYWRPFVDRPRGQYEYGERNDPETVNRLGLCEGIGMLAQQYERDEDGDRGAAKTGVLAAVEDLSENGFLRTAAKFGCVLWAAK